MTLAEAIRIVDQEYSDEVDALTQETQAATIKRIEDDFNEILSCEDILDQIIGHVHDDSDMKRIAVMAIRFGMRVQRKIDNPSRVTSVLDKLASAA